MASNQLKKAREERLAGKLRENLRRRKSQGRAIEAEADSPKLEDSTPTDSALPKADSNS